MKKKRQSKLMFVFASLKSLLEEEFSYCFGVNRELIPHGEPFMMLQCLK